jgi:hypothetical protein
MLEDMFDHQWFSIDLDNRIKKLDKIKNRLRSIASQKSEPKVATVEKHIQAGDIAYQELKEILDNYFKSPELRANLYIYFEDIEQFFGPTRTMQHMHYQLTRLEDYLPLRQAALQRINKNKPQRNSLWLLKLLKLSNS